MMMIMTDKDDEDINYNNMQDKYDGDVMVRMMIRDNHKNMTTKK